MFLRSRLRSLVRGEPFSREAQLILVVAVVVCGSVAYLFFTDVLWLLHWPLTRMVGTTAPIAAAVLLCMLDLRGRAAAIATGPILVYGVVGLAMSARMIEPAIVFSPSMLVVVIIGVAVSAPMALAALHGLRASPSHGLLAMASVLATLAIPAIDLAAHQLGPAGELKSAIDQAREGDRIRIADHTEFEWDRLHVFGHYTSDQEIEEALGFAWGDPFILGIEMSEAHELFVFVKDQRVVRAYELFHGEGFCDKFSNHSWSREEAVFEVDDPSDHCLAPTSANFGSSESE